MPDFKIMAVTGNPVLHSKSPLLFNALLEIEQSGIYTRLAADSAEEALYLFGAIGICGMNVTAPFKNSILPGADSVNCVNYLNNALHGFNTDLAGISDSFKKRGIGLRSKKVIVIGAGGAARAAVSAMVNEQAVVCIVNRTPEKAEALAKEFKCASAKLEDLADLLQTADVVISTLAAEHNVIREKWLTAGLVVMDADYKNALLTKMALRQNCLVIRGEEWLINQALPAYRAFTGREADEKIMRSALDSGQALHKSRIALIGFMGCGKSSAGRLLADKLGWQFADTDNLIEQKAQKSIAEIFKTDGEAVFRQIESAVLRELVNQEKIVIATGGGVVVNPDNRKLLKADFLPIWLFVTAETAVNRTENTPRPLLKCTNPLQKAQELMRLRKNLYAQSCELIVNSESKNKIEVVEKIYDEIRRIL